MAASSSVQDLILCDLRDRPEFREAVIAQNLESWGAFTDLNRAEMAALFALAVPRRQLPITFIAVLAGRYVGCVSLRAVTMGAVKHKEVYSDATPWLSNMWVAEEARGHGIASKLTECVLNAACDMGFKTLYSSVATEDSLYHKMGFRTTLSRAYGGYTVYLIEKTL